LCFFGNGCKYNCKCNTKSINCNCTYDKHCNNCEQGGFFANIIENHYDRILKNKDDASSVLVNFTNVLIDICNANPLPKNINLRTL
jgi:hypothetical protein